MNSQKQNGMTGRWIAIKGLMHMFSYSKFCSTHSRDRMGKVCGPPYSWGRGGWGQRAMYVRIFIDYMCKFGDIEQPCPLFLDCGVWTLFCLTYAARVPSTLRRAKPNETVINVQGFRALRKSK